MTNAERVRTRTAVMARCILFNAHSAFGIRHSAFVIQHSLCSNPACSFSGSRVLGLQGSEVLIMRNSFVRSIAALGVLQAALFAQTPPRARAPQQPQANAPVIVLKPARVFDGDTMHEGWTVRVHGDRVEAAGPGAASVTADQVIDLPGTTLLPGL